MQKQQAPFIKYLQDIISFTRKSGYFKNRLSPRARINILQAAKSWAVIHSKDYVRLTENLESIFSEPDSKFLVESNFQPCGVIVSVHKFFMGSENNVI